jgi:hypothetical protein
MEKRALHSQSHEGERREASEGQAMKATYTEGDRIEIRESAGGMWKEATVTDVEPGKFFAVIGNTVYEITSRMTWPKHRLSAKPAPKVRLMRPPPPIAGPVDGFAEASAKLEGVARALGWQPPQPARDFKPQPKPLPPDRNLGYLKWVAMQPCCLTGEEGRSEAHHWFGGAKGMGQKVSDWHVCPLTPEMHRYWHDHGHLPDMTREQSETLFYRTQARLLALWLTDAKTP